MNSIDKHLAEFEKLFDEETICPDCTKCCHSIKIFIKQALIKVREEQKDRDAGIVQKCFDGEDDLIGIEHAVRNQSNE